MAGCYVCFPTWLSLLARERHVTAHCTKEVYNFYSNYISEVCLSGIVEVACALWMFDVLLQVSSPHWCRRIPNSWPPGKLGRSVAAEMPRSPAESDHPSRRNLPSLKLQRKLKQDFWKRFDKKCEMFDSFWKKTTLQNQPWFNVGAWIS